MQPAGVYNVSYEQDMALVRTRTQWALLLAFVAFMATVPLFAPSRFLTFLIFTGIYVTGLHGLNILMGYAGQISLGHAAFMAVGAFATGTLAVQAHAPLPLALLGGGLITAAVALILGTPSLRVKGYYLLMATLASHFIIVFVIHRTGFISGDLGLLIPRPSLLGITFDTEAKFYYLVMAVVIIMTYFAKNIVRTRMGRAFVAVRDNDLAAEVMGINVFLYKVMAFGVSGFFAGVGGGLVAYYIGMAHTQYFTILDAVFYQGMLVVGGLGTTMGVFYGVAFFRLIDEVMITAGPTMSALLPITSEASSGIAMMLWAVVIIVFLIFEPRGINRRWEILKAYYRLHPFAH